MKYIRTKETEYGCIIDTEKYLKETGEQCYIPENEIVKQADTIEELCDEFVITNWKEKGKPVLCKYQIDKNALYYIDENGFNALYLPYLLKLNCKVNGAIWTDKGLIYVAKMNDKGDWELL